jgi:hypothetical protein
MTLRNNSPTSKEIKNLRRLIKTVCDDRQAVAQSLLLEIEFMSKTLIKLKEEVELEGPTSVIVQGSQTLPCINPSLKAYTSLIQRFGVIYKQLTDLLPQSEGTKEKDALLEFLKKY